MIDELNGLPSNPDFGHYPLETFLSWKQILELISSGWTLGCHGWQHLDSTRINDQVFKENILRCKAAIAIHTGLSARWLAFTWGRFEERHLIAAKALGMDYAFSCIHGGVNVSLEDEAIDAVNRIDIRPDVSLTDFSSIVMGNWDFLGRLQLMRLHLRAGNAR